MSKRFISVLFVFSSTLLSGYAAAAEPYRIALVEQAGRETVVEALAGALAEQGFVLERLVEAALTDEARFNRDRFECLCLSDARAYPEAAQEVLERFFKDGGDAVLLGGHAFQKPLWFYESRWMDAQQVQALLAEHLRDRRELIDLGTTEAKDWQHGHRRENQSRLLIGNGDDGAHILLDIKEIGAGDWDTFKHAIEGVSGEYNAISFYAKASERTRDLVIEIDEQDHSRWVFVQELTDDWAHYVIVDHQFRFFGDGSPVTRGFKGDQLKLANAKSLSFGLAWGFSHFEPGDHQIYLHGMESAYAVVPDSFTRLGKRLALPIYDEAGYYTLRGVRTVKAYEEAALATAYERPGAWSGVSAVGFPYPDRSAYLPLLGAYDAYGRRVGFAAGALVHYDGPYSGGCWLIAGIEEAAFYAEPQTARYVAKILKCLIDPQLQKGLKDQNKTSKAQRLPLATPPDGFITISEDGRHFLKPDGTKFFILGSNYLGSFDRKCYHGDSSFDAAYLERDFRKAKEAGINCLRFWNFGLDRDSDKMRTVLELARRYRIYLILHPTAHPKPTDRELAALFEANAKLVADEPMVIGYDLMNEPLITTVGSISFKGGPSSILRHGAYDAYDASYFDKKWVDRLVETRAGWPELGDWIRGQDAKDLYAANFIAYRYMERCISSEDASSLVGMDRLMPYPAEYEPLFAAIDATFSDWITLHREALNAFGSRHYLTVGYHTPLATLPANQKLDFISHHLYQLPITYENLHKAVTTFDRLRLLFPDKPITLGEFGYSSGYKLASGAMLDGQSAAVAEMMIFLYAFAHDFSGAMNWMVSEWPVPNIQFNGDWIAPENQRMQSGYGLYYYDGTLTGQPKPIVAATRFFRRYSDAHEPGQGVLEISPESSTIGARYVYRNTDAIFIGARQYQDNRLAFEHERPVNVMLSWMDNKLLLMACDDVTITLYPRAWGAAAFLDTPEGMYRTFENQSDRVRVGLAAGEFTTLTYIPEKL